MPEARSEVLSTPMDQHGGPDGSREELLDFSVNSNPFGPPDNLLTAIRAADLSQYPDPTASRAGEAIGDHHGCSPCQVTLGNGTAELIHRLAACYLTPGRRVLIAGPTFGEYARASALYGAELVRLKVYENREIPDVAPLLDAIHNVRPTLVWLCHPNNPTGHAWTASQLEILANTCLRNDALLVIDAAYLEMSGVASEALPDGALTLWSLTKSFCIPGLRVGYATAPREVVAHLTRVAAPWQASGPAQVAALWARSAEGRSFLERTVPELLATGRALRRKLQEVGYRTQPGVTPFFLLEVGNAAAFKDAARERGFRVRDATSFGLPRHVRLAPQQEQANASLLEWMRRRRHG